MIIYKPVSKKSRAVHEQSKCLEKNSPTDAGKPILRLEEISPAMKRFARYTPGARFLGERRHV
jgi:hypothetical protein